MLKLPDISPKTAPLAAHGPRLIYAIEFRPICYLVVGKYTNGEITEMLDKFFEDPETRLLQVADAMDVIAMKMRLGEKL